MTVTNSVTRLLTKYIDKEYFTTKSQRAIKDRNNEDPDWIQLEKDMMGFIRSNIKTKMILNAQQVGLNMILGENEQLV